MSIADLISALGYSGKDREVSRAEEVANLYPDRLSDPNYRLLKVGEDPAPGDECLQLNGEWQKKSTGTVIRSWYTLHRRRLSDREIFVRICTEAGYNPTTLTGVNETPRIPDDYEIVPVGESNGFPYREPKEGYGYAWQEDHSEYIVKCYHAPVIRLRICSCESKRTCPRCPKLMPQLARNLK